MALLLVLTASATAVATSIYLYISRSEQAQFQSQFRDEAHKIVEAFGSNLDKTLGLFDSVAVALVSTARLSNQSWPFVTIPDFAHRMSKLLPHTLAVNINVLPLVTPEERRAWEAYSVANDKWVNEGMKFQENWDRFHGPVVYNGTRRGVIHGDFGDLPYNIRYFVVCLGKTRTNITLWSRF